MINITISLAKKNKEKTIVFRPHPDEERNAMFLKKLKRYKNIKIADEFDVIPWIIQSEVIVHSCSTVAIQAFFLKKNVDQYHKNTPSCAG